MGDYFTLVYGGCTIGFSDYMALPYRHREDLKRMLEEVKEREAQHIADLPNA